MKVGDTGQPFVDSPLTVTDFVRYQGASGDMNPIHHDPAVALRAGYPGPFAVGMLQAGVLATYVTDWLGAEHIRRFKVRFQEQAWPGDVLTYTGTIVAVDNETVDVELTVARQTGAVHIKGWATFAREQTGE